MDDRRQQTGRDEASGREGSDYGSGGGSAMTRQQSSEMARGGGSRGSSGDWQGYVVPYRYYGPGYQGVGYYSVMYQGPGGDDEPGQRGDQGRWEQGRQGQWQQGEPWQQRQGGQDQGGVRQGGYAGRGPKGYQRSDERLREEINDRLTANDEVDAGDIEVQVRQGEVTLTGTVQDRWMKRRAEDLAEQVMGVRDVMNQIRVQGDRQPSGTSDSGRSTESTTMGQREQGEPNGKRRTTSTGTR